MAEKDELPSLDSLREKIDSARHIEPTETAASAQGRQSASLAWRCVSEMVAGIAVGGFLGYYADAWLETNPAFLIAGIFLGMAGGIMNIYRVVSKDSDDPDLNAGEE